MRLLVKLLVFMAVIIPVFLVSYALAVYLMTAPSSVPVSVNPPGDWSWGPGWNP